MVKWASQINKKASPRGRVKEWSRVWKSCLGRLKVAALGQVGGVPVSPRNSLASNDAVGLTNRAVAIASIEIEIQTWDSRKELDQLPGTLQRPDYFSITEKFLNLLTGKFSGDSLVGSLISRLNKPPARLFHLLILLLKVPMLIFSFLGEEALNH